MESLKDTIRFLKGATEGALATLNGSLPHVSSVGFFFELESTQNWGRAVLFLSDLAQHTKNIQKNPHASLLAVEKSDLPVHEKRRATLEGKVAAVKLQETQVGYKKQYLSLFPKSEIFFTLADFKFYELEIDQIHWYGGFGKAAVFTPQT